MMKDILNGMNVDVKRYPVNMVRSLISSAKNELTDPDEYARAGPDAPGGDRRARPMPSCRSACAAPTPWTSTTCSSTRTCC